MTWLAACTCLKHPTYLPAGGVTQSTFCFVSSWQQSKTAILQEDAWQQWMWLQLIPWNNQAVTRRQRQGFIVQVSPITTTKTVSLQNLQKVPSDHMPDWCGNCPGTFTSTVCLLLSHSSQVLLLLSFPPCSEGSSSTFWRCAQTSFPSLMTDILLNKHPFLRNVFSGHGLSWAVNCGIVT